MVKNPQLTDIALKLEMAVTARHEKHYHSERSRNKDIISDYKMIIRDAMDRTDDRVQKYFIYSLGYLLMGRYLDELSNEEFNEILVKTVHFLKNELSGMKFSQPADVEKPQEVVRVTKSTKSYSREDFFT